MTTIAVVLAILILPPIIGPLMARAFDRATVALIIRLSKHPLTSSEIDQLKQRAHQRYSRVYIPQPVKNAINRILGQLHGRNRVLKQTVRAGSSKEADTNPLDKQTLDAANSPFLEPETDSSHKAFHAPDSSTTGNTP